MVRLTQIRIDRFRNVKPGALLRFGPTFNVLLGKSATGKSMLLDLIAAVTNDDLSPYAKDDAGFDLTWWLEHGTHQVQIEAKRTPLSTILPLCTPGGEQAFDEAWTMLVRSDGVDIGRIELRGTQGVWRVRGEPDVPFDGKGPFTVYRGSERLLVAALVAVHRRMAEQEHSGMIPVHPAQAVFNPCESAGKFDEGVASLETITRSTLEIGGGSSVCWEGWLPRVARNSLATGSTVVSFRSLPGLDDIPRLLGFADAELRPRLLTRSENGKNATARYAGFDCLFRHADGSQISHELLSFGQTRLFAFLWYFAVREQLPIVADELSNGLHHEWIQLCVDRLLARQSFLATQNPLLLDHIPVESAEAARMTFIRCTLEQGPDAGRQMAWRNFDEEEAERFFVAYQTGVQQISELLRSEGLW